MNQWRKWTLISVGVLAPCALLGYFYSWLVPAAAIPAALLVPALRLLTSSGEQDFINFIHEMLEPWYRWRHAQTPLSVGEGQNSLKLAASEADEIALVERFKHQPTIRVCGITTHCQFFPSDLWKIGHADRCELLFSEDSALRRSIRVELDSSAPVLIEPQVMLSELSAALQSGRLSAIQARTAREVYKRLTEGHMNPYPRLVSLPTYVTRCDEYGHDELRIVLAPSVYGIHLLSMRKLPLPSIRKNSNRAVSSLGIRFAYTYERDGRSFALFQQRSSAADDFACSWEIGAGGYVDPRRHQREGHLSLVMAAELELREEFSLPEAAFPYKDNFVFFGVSRDVRTGDVSVAGECRGVLAPDLSRLASDEIIGVAESELTPEAMASFLCEPRGSNSNDSKPRWVGEGIVQIVLVLEAHGFPRAEIERAFMAERVSSRIDLST